MEATMAKIADVTADATVMTKSADERKQLLARSVATPSRLH
jgi:hypothetical protein